MHRRGGRLEEMPAIGKVLVAIPGNLQPRLMHQSRGLQRLATLLVSHADNGSLRNSS